MKKIIEYVKAIQECPNEREWALLVTKLRPIVKHYAKNAPLEHREDLEQTLWMEVIKVVRDFELRP